MNTRIRKLTRDLETAKKALKKIAAYDDVLADEHLQLSGSYGGFDNPSAVKLARETLTELRKKPPK